MIRKCFVCQSEEIRGEADRISYVVCSDLCSVVYDMWDDKGDTTLTLKEAHTKALTENGGDDEGLDDVG